MPTLNELLSTTADTDDIVFDNFQFIVDENLRTISVPALGVVFGVEGDKDVNYINFSMVRFYDGTDLSEMELHVNYINAAGDMNYYRVPSIVVQNDTIMFSWLLSHDVTKYRGTTSFTLHFFKQVNGIISKSYNTTPAHGIVLEGINAENYVTEEEQYDILTHLQAELNNYTTVKKTELAMSGQTMLNAIQQKGAATLASIPEDYTTLNNKIKNMEDHFIVTDPADVNEVTQIEMDPSAPDREVAEMSDLDNLQSQIDELNEEIDKVANATTDITYIEKLKNVEPIDGESKEDRQNIAFTLNAEHTKIVSPRSSANNKESIVCAVDGGKTYKIAYYKTVDVRYGPGYAFVDGELNVLLCNEPSTGSNQAVVEDVVAPIGCTKVYVMHSSAKYDPTVEELITEETYTPKAYDKSETYTKEEVDAIVSDSKSKHKARILVNFDDPLRCFTDGRHELCKKYKIPYTVNVSIDGNGNVKYPGYPSENYIDAMLRDGVDFAIYSALSPVDDAGANDKYNDDTYLSEWTTYANLSRQYAESVGIFNPTAFFCRYMKTGTTLNKALIASGFKICRGYKYPSESTAKYFDTNTFSNVDATKFNVTARGCNVTSNSGNPMALIEYIDYAVENGLDIAPFAHGVFATEEEARSHNGTTREILETVLSHIRDLVDQEVAEVCTFREYYKLKYPSDGMMNDIARERKYSDWKYGQTD